MLISQSIVLFAAVAARQVYAAIIPETTTANTTIDKRAFHAQLNFYKDAHCTQYLSQADFYNSKVSQECHHINVATGLDGAWSMNWIDGTYRTGAANILLYAFTGRCGGTQQGGLYRSNNYCMSFSLPGQWYVAESVGF